MPTLPTSIVPGQLGHISHHDALHLGYDLLVDGSTLAALPPGAPVGSLARVTDSIRGVWIKQLSGWHSVTGHADVKDFGVLGDGATDDTTAIANAMAALAALGTWVTAFFPASLYLATSVASPARVSVRGAGREATRIRNINTGGNNFFQVLGSQVTIEDLTVDGNRAAQLASSGGALVVAKPNGAGGLAGGMALSGVVLAGATSFDVTSASFGGQPLLPGDAVTFFEGVALEIVRVSRTYAGGTNVPVDRPFTSSWTVAAKVTAAATNVTVRNVLALGCGNAGVTVYHGIDCNIIDNYVRDCFDVGIDLPDAGSRHVLIRGNQIESDCRFGIALDTATADFGRVQHCSILGNQIRLLNGADTRYAIWLGSVNDILVEGNTCDLLKAGAGAVRLDQDSFHVAVVGNHLYGRGVTGVFGVECVNTGAEDRRVTVAGNIIRDFDVGVELSTTPTAVVVGNSIFNSINYGVSTLANGLAAIQDICVTGNLIDTCFAGVRAGGAPIATAKLRARENTIINVTFAKFTVDPGWLGYTDDSDAPLPDTIGAALAALEAEVNLLKARMRTFGVLRP